MPGWLAESLGISLAAQAATLPDVLATFGRLSLVSPAVNLAVVPLVPAAMLGGVVAMLAGAASAARRAAARRHDRGPAGLDRAPRHRARSSGSRPPSRSPRSPCRRAARRPLRPRPASRSSAARPPSAWLRRRRPARGAGVEPSQPGRRAATTTRAAPRTNATRIGLAATALVVAIVGLGARRRDPSGRRGSPSSTSGRATRSCSRRGPAPGCSSTAGPIPTGSCWRWTSGSRHGTGGSTSSC